MVGDPKQKRKILVAGATQVGKTWLLAAMERAALQNREGEARITFATSMASNGHTPESGDFISQATSEYLSRAADFFLRGIPFASTQQAQRYDFKLGVQHAASDVVEEFEFLDAPGEFTSPTDPKAISEDRQKLLDEARQGYALVFCFEALPDSNPGLRLSNLEFNLSTLLGNLTTAAGRINYDRILFLLTKIDIVTGVFHDRLFRGNLAVPLTPLHLAQRLDPLEQMRAVVGSENIAKFLVPDSTCELAVGICSAIGFDRGSGQTMVSPYTGVPLMPPGRTPQEHYLRWTPFGVREALLFLTLGIPSPSTRTIRHGDADFQTTPRVAQIPYRSCV